MALTEKQRRFADEWIANGGNATQAAIAAGYSKRTARAMGSENLTKPDIKEYIKERTEAIDAARVAQGDEVLAFLTAVMRGDEQETVFLKNGFKYVGVNVTDQKNQIKAAEILAKCHGLMVQKVEHQGPIAVTFVDDLQEDDGG
ncbi:terminase small subunit [Gordonibacter urolithinfaciens]|uniref:terminase small subunit n=1 Tax=Gordonibacter urolithinfaciens TaxID=1335613 RepID=UPI0034BC4D60